MEDPSLYQYSPIKPAKNIRILRLTGGNSNILFADLIETTLGSHLPYEAISYTWGDPKKSHTLAIRVGSNIKITKSLYNALRAIRHSRVENGARNIWADGVCINQDDIDERIQQVRLMAEVYRSAKRVITYIGENTHDIDQGIMLANKLLAKSGDIPADNDHAWASLRDFLTRPWCSRIWIVQESLHNPNMIMMCGDVEIDWNVYSKMILMMQQSAFDQYRAAQPRLEWQVGAMQGMVTMRAEYQKSSPMLLELLAGSRDFRCTDPRDRVFALLSLCPKVKINPDYNKSSVEIFTETALHLLSSAGLLMLSYAGVRRKPDVPSWVPDWSEPVDEIPVVQCRHFRASGNLKPKIPIDVSTPGTLPLCGIVHDEIIHVTDTLRRDFVTARMTRYSWARDQYLRLTSSGRHAYTGGQTYLEALWRTLISDLDYKHRFQKGNVNAPSSLGRDFEAYVRPVKDWARSEAAKGLVTYHPSQKPKAPPIDSEVIKAWEKDLSLDTTKPDEDDGRENVFSQLRRHGPIHEKDCRGDKYRDSILHAGNLYRRFFTTKSGYIGMCVVDIAPGDIVATFSGATVPFVLRPHNKASEFRLISDCYVHGLMNGEAWQGMRGGLGGATRVLTLV
ncbi:heterokaryon incompatibility protein-domain-containing protein [Dactylonectria estremocensis]|uniref:Heterokaryon incompatibility protein-domain-containing protein n=1 Tax=Dactylonectria estremocensis TaxID=1079267 RepID=A0A9P9FBW9_9HYPO|nr:heterokaryon incompatibility protein-domain-containing protein [Dactylonectria estremocensis]